MTETVYYDGSCGLCHRLVLLTLRLDKQAHFRFAPLGSETFHARVASEQMVVLPDSVVVQTADGRLLTRSRALVHILEQCRWPSLARLLRLLPVSVADRLYDFVARRRKRWFAPPADACPLVPEHLRGRFLP